MSHKPLKDPYNSKTFRKEAIALAFSVAPNIYPCRKCGHPVLDGYVCGTCGNDSDVSANDYFEPYDPDWS